MTSVELSTTLGPANPRPLVRVRGLRAALDRSLDADSVGVLAHLLDHTAGVDDFRGKERSRYGDPFEAAPSRLVVILQLLHRQLKLHLHAPLGSASNAEKTLEESPWLPPGALATGIGRACRSFAQAVQLVGVFLEPDEDGLVQQVVVEPSEVLVGCPARQDEARQLHEVVTHFPGADLVGRQQILWTERVPVASTRPHVQRQARLQHDALLAVAKKQLDGALLRQEAPLRVLRFLKQEVVLEGRRLGRVVVVRVDAFHHLHEGDVEVDQGDHQHAQDRDDGEDQDDVPASLVRGRQIAVQLHQGHNEQEADADLTQNHQLIVADFLERLKVAVDGEEGGGDDERRGRLGHAGFSSISNETKNDGQGGQGETTDTVDELEVVEGRLVGIPEELQALRAPVEHPQPEVERKDVAVLQQEVAIQTWHSDGIHQNHGSRVRHHVVVRRGEALQGVVGDQEALPRVDAVAQEGEEGVGRRRRQHQEKHQQHDVAIRRLVLGQEGRQAQQESGPEHLQGAIDLLGRVIHAFVRSL
mmetsp:Transcript_10769/g.40421  ORF Transcript_10769/g.40421 Transcript_10769/m.40421 type:complete len:530 (+) Transcript_10769:1154-2743(+)